MLHVNGYICDRVCVAGGGGLYVKKLICADGAGSFTDVQ